ncbi:MAG: hypothetical protein GY809_17230 [Planctomycetes bacterium]|nr:hypothetical protein [Planctomycetota bacterium]
MLRSTKLAWLVLGMLVVSGTASAIEEVAVDATLDYVGKYIWRGKVVTNDPALQPGVTVGLDKLTLGVWGSIDLTNVNGDRNRFQEVDYYVDYTDALPDADGINYSVGAILYHFPTTKGSTNATTEVYAGLGFECLLNPTVTLYYDIDDADGFYGNAGVSHSLDISEYGIAEDMINSVDFAASLGVADKSYNKYYWGKSVNATNDFVMSATLPVELCSNATLNATCSYVSLLDGSIKGGAAGQNSSYVYGGIGLAVSF